MRRREFISLAGAAASAVLWPATARSQPGTVPVIGFLRSTTLADSTYIVSAFRDGLKEAGFVEGQNVAVEYSFGDNDRVRLRGLAQELVKRGVAVIVGNFEAVRALQATTKTVPVVFAFGGDPVKEGLVESLNRPAGNITGVTFLNSVLGAKRLELLHQLVPGATPLAVLVNPGSATTDAERAEVQAAAQAIGRQLIVRDVGNERDLETAFDAFAQQTAAGLFVGAGAFLNSHRRNVIALAARYRLPACYNTREFVGDGGLMSYGPGITAGYRQAGLYAGRILKGEKPADLPVMQSTKFEFVISLKIAKELGLAVPQSLLVAADDVIE